MRNTGERDVLPLAAAEKIQVYAVRELPVALGERLKITENGTDTTGKHRLNNGDMVRVNGFTVHGGLILENGWELSPNFGHLTHGYAITADAAQAKTVDAVYAAIGRDSIGATDMRRVYVTLSRAREDARIYTDSKEEVLQAAQRDTVRRSATELLGEERAREVLQQIRDREAVRQQEVFLREHREQERQREIVRERTREREIDREITR
jgi:hypothetical protein